MLHAIAQSLVICVVGSVLYFVLAGISLNYFVAKNHPQQHILQVFLEDLRFPFDRIVTFLPTGKPEGAAESLLQDQLKNVTVLRYVSGIVMIVILLLFGYGLFQQENIEGIVSTSLILLFFSVYSFIAWRFGHKLKATEASL